MGTGCEKRVQVCLIAPVPPPYGGIANWTNLLLQDTPKDEIEYNVINIAPKKRALDGRTIFDRIVISGFDIFRKRKQLKKILNSKRIDVVHMTSSGKLALIRDHFLLNMVAKKKISSVYHIRVGTVKQIAEKNTLEWKIMHLAMRKASVVIVLDKADYIYLQTFYKELNTKLIANPVDIKKIEKVNFKNRKKQIIFLGWCIEAKGIRELLEAWQRIYRKNSEWELKIIGPYDKQYMQTLSKRYSFAGIDVLGEVSHDQVIEILLQSSIFAFPTYSEGFPNALVEAMATGNAVVACGVGAIPEMLEKDCGIVIEPRNVQQLEERLQFLIDNENARIDYGIRARGKAIKEYSFEEILKQYMKIWRNEG